MGWSPELDVDADLARRLITHQFPSIAAKTVERYGAGMDNVAMLVDELYVFRFPRRAIVVPLLERETRILPAIAPLLPLAIPVPDYAGKPDLGYPWGFAGYKRLHGTTACSAELSIDERAALACPLGEFLRALHGIDARIAVDVKLPGDEIGRLDHGIRYPLAQERFAELADAGLIDKAQARGLLAFLESNAPGETRGVRCIVHGDLYARHLLVDDDHRLCGVIDWGDVHLGDPALDLMAAFSMLPSSSHSQFIETYGGVDERTWNLARYRAIYHGALVATFGMQIHDEALRDAGLAGLRLIGGYDA